MANRIWLEADLTHSYLPKIERLTDTPQGHTAAKRLLQLMRDNWANQHGLKETRQQQGCIDQVRRTIKEVLGEEHWSLDFIKFSTEEYIQLNDLKQDRVAHRNEAVRWLDNPDAIVATAVRLLKSPEWAEIAAGLAVLTGRRVSELLATAHFTPKTKWSVLFSGAVKRGKESGLSFEIPTLTTAQNVCEALAKIRLELPQAQEISIQAVNATFEPAVIRACDQHFAGLVPTREGKDALYTHLFRAVYATIASFWYCPQQVNEIEFRAAIQGHFQILNESRSTLRRSLAASRHYSDYEISDAVIAQYQGKRKGIKLGIAGIEVIEMFKDAVIRGTTVPEKGRGKTTASVRIWKEDKELLELLLIG
jgi:Telomere resolvase